MEFHKPSTLDRRSFLRSATAAALGLAALGGGTAASATGQARTATRSDRGPNRVPRGNISIQLYSLRSLMTDPTAVEMVLGTLHEFGYRKVETAGTYGLGAAGFREILDRVGLWASSAHIGGVDDPPALADEAAALGARFANFPYAAYNTLDEWRALTDGLNAVGAAMRDVGVRYGYHNHAQEFLLEENGVQAYDILLDECDSNLVHMQLDLYWAVTGGVDPVEVFSRDPHRFRQFHVKDRAPDGFFADPGEGTIDFPRIFAERRESGVIEYIAENDQPADPIEFAQTAHDYLSDVRF